MKRMKEVASRGDRLKTLRELRNVLAETIDETDSGRDIAALSRQMTQVLAEIDALEHSDMGKVDSLDEIRNRFKVAK